MKKILMLTLLFSFISTQSFAAACYTPEQYRAEQAIRFHTQFMVIGMLCKKSFGEDAYVSYENFTQRNQGVIGTQENRLISYFGKAKEPAPERAFHSLRTKIANDYSLQAMKISGSFCRGMVQRYNMASMMKPADFEAWIAKSEKNKGIVSSKPLCAAARRNK